MLKQLPEKDGFLSKRKTTGVGITYEEHTLSKKRKNNRYLMI